MRLQLSVHSPDIVVLNGKENKTVRVWMEKQFGGKESFVFGSLVFQW
jgi:hypothetical protein